MHYFKNLTFINCANFFNTKFDVWNSNSLWICLDYLKIIFLIFSNKIIDYLWITFSVLYFSNIFGDMHCTAHFREIYCWLIHFNMFKNFYILISKLFGIKSVGNERKKVTKSIGKINVLFHVLSQAWRVLQLRLSFQIVKVKMTFVLWTDTCNWKTCSSVTKEIG